MSDAEALLRALTWFSPGFPTGAFAYSHGLEQAVDAGLVTSAVELEGWIEAILRHGGGWSDAVLLKLTLEGQDVRELAVSLTPTSELMQETLTQGRAFALAAAAMDAHAAAPAMAVAEPLPIAVGHAALAAGLPASITLQGYLHGLASHLVSAGVRLIPLGQTAGVAVLNRLEHTVLGTARDALDAGPDDLGSCCLMVEWCSMRHETQTTRLFRS